MLDELKEDLLNIRKNLEKNLIRTFVASQSHATSENRKQMIKQMKKAKINDLKSASADYLDSFTVSAKGKWVSQAKQTFKQAAERFDQL